jgi:hypothetical protein
MQIIAMLFFVVVYIVISIFVSRLYFQFMSFKNPDFLEKLFNIKLKKEAKVFGLFWVVTIPIYSLLLIMDIVLDITPKNKKEV